MESSWRPRPRPVRGHHTDCSACAYGGGSAVTAPQRSESPTCPRIFLASQGRAMGATYSPAPRPGSRVEK